MDTMTLTDNIQATLEAEPDESLDLLVLMPPESEPMEPQQALEILLEATRVVRQDGKIVSGGPLGAVIALMYDPEADPDPQYVYFIDEILAMLGRDDLDPATLLEGEGF